MVVQGRNALAALALVSLTVSSDHSCFAFIQSPSQGASNRNERNHIPVSGLQGPRQTISGPLAGQPDNIPGMGGGVDEVSMRTLYDNWRKTHKKGGMFDQRRYETFKSNYLSSKAQHEAATVRARQESRPSPGPLQLNKFADLSPEEYKAVRQHLMARKKDEVDGPNAADVSTLNKSKGDELYRPPPSVVVGAYAEKQRQFKESTGLDLSPSIAVGSAAGLKRQQWRRQPLGQSHEKESPSKMAKDSEDHPLDAKYEDAGFPLDIRRCLEHDVSMTQRDRIRIIYSEYCSHFGKKMNERRLDVFAKRLLTLLQVQRGDQWKATNKDPVRLNAYADLSMEEYQTFKAREAREAELRSATPLSSFRLEKQQQDEQLTPRKGDKPDGTNLNVTPEDDSVNEKAQKLNETETGDKPSSADIGIISTEDRDLFQRALLQEKLRNDSRETLIADPARTTEPDIHVKKEMFQRLLLSERIRNDIKQDRALRLSDGAPNDVVEGEGSKPKEKKVDVMAAAAARQRAWEEAKDRITASNEKSGLTVSSEEEPFDEIPAAKAEKWLDEEERELVGAEERFRKEQEARQRALELANRKAEELVESKREAEAFRLKAEQETFLREEVEARRKQEEIRRMEAEASLRQKEEELRELDAKWKTEREARAQVETKVRSKSKELLILQEKEAILRSEFEAAQQEADRVRREAEAKDGLRVSQIESLKEEERKLRNQLEDQLQTKAIAASRSEEVSRLEEEVSRLQGQAEASRREAETARQVAEARLLQSEEQIDTLKLKEARLLDDVKSKTESEAEALRIANEFMLLRDQEAELREQAEHGQENAEKDVERRLSEIAELKKDQARLKVQLKEAKQMEDKAKEDAKREANRREIMLQALRDKEASYQTKSEQAENEAESTILKLKSKMEETEENYTKLKNKEMLLRERVESVKREAKLESERKAQEFEDKIAKEIQLRRKAEVASQKAKAEAAHQNEELKKLEDRIAREVTKAKLEAEQEAQRVIETERKRLAKKEHILEEGGQQIDNPSSKAIGSPKEGRVGIIQYKELFQRSLLMARLQNAERGAQSSENLDPVETGEQAKSETDLITDMLSQEFQQEELDELTTLLPELGVLINPGSDGKPAFAAKIASAAKNKQSAKKEERLPQFELNLSETAAKIANMVDSLSETMTMFSKAREVAEKLKDKPPSPRVKEGENKSAKDMDKKGTLTTPSKPSNIDEDDSNEVVLEKSAVDRIAKDMNSEDAIQTVDEKLSVLSRLSSLIGDFMGDANDLGGSKERQKPFEPKDEIDGIPLLRSWILNTDGSITGLVSNSKDFENGSEITIAPVESTSKSGEVVTTKSGSRYLLIGKGEIAEARSSSGTTFKEDSTLTLAPGYGFENDLADGTDIPNSGAESMAQSLKSLFQISPRSTAVDNNNSNENPKNEIDPPSDGNKEKSPISFIMHFGGSTKEAELIEEQPESSPKQKKGLPFASTLGRSTEVKETEKEKRDASHVTKKTKKGGKKVKTVAVISDWEQNDDGSITGMVTNSEKFPDGDYITTTPLRNRAKAGRIVRTTGGTRYRLT